MFFTLSVPLFMEREGVFCLNNYYYLTLFAIFAT